MMLTLMINEMVVGVLDSVTTLVLLELILRSTNLICSMYTTISTSYTGIHTHHQAYVRHS